MLEIRTREATNNAQGPAVVSLTLAVQCKVFQELWVFLTKGLIPFEQHVEVASARV